MGALRDKWPELPARWDKPENLHVTLFFLGSVNDQEVCEICLAANEVGKRHDPFDLTLYRISYGPPKKHPDDEDEVRPWRPRMVWVGGRVSEELGALQKDLESALFEFAGGDYSESGGYGFSPHITLARIDQTGLKNMEAEEIPVIDEEFERTFLVESFEIMESEMKRGGPVYTVLESVKLGGEN